MNLIIALVTLGAFFQSALAATINIAWAAHSYTAITAAVGDKIVFKGTAIHNLYKMPTVASFTSCTFTGATKLGYITTYTYTVTAADKVKGTIRFACSPHCASNNQKIAVKIV
jgi:plastocyanin